MEKVECWSCFGGGVVQEDWDRGYYGVCQTCQGDGHQYFVSGREVSKEEYEAEEDAYYYDD